MLKRLLDGIGSLQSLKKVSKAVHLIQKFLFNWIDTIGRSQLINSKLVVIWIIFKLKNSPASCMKHCQLNITVTLETLFQHKYAGQVLAVLMLARLIHPLLHFPETQESIRWTLQVSQVLEWSRVTLAAHGQKRNFTSYIKCKKNMENFYKNFLTIEIEVFNPTKMSSLRCRIYLTISKRLKRN